MSWDINQVVVIGRLTRDPELRYSQSGLAICPLGVAVGSKRAGNESNSVSFFNAVTFGKTAEHCAQYLKKGKQIGIRGRLEQSSWEDQNGTKRSKVEIIAEQVQFLSSPQGSSGDNPNYAKKNTSTTSDASNVEPYEDLSEDDDIPF